MDELGTDSDIPFGSDSVSPGRGHPQFPEPILLRL